MGVVLKVHRRGEQRPAADSEAIPLLSLHCPCKMLCGCMSLLFREAIKDATFFLEAEDN